MGFLRQPSTYIKNQFEVMDNIKRNLPSDITFMTAKDMILYNTDYGDDNDLRTRVKYIYPDNYFSSEHPLSSEFFLAITENNVPVSEGGKIISVMVCGSYDDDTLSVTGISTDEEFRRQGYATKLLSAYFELCNNNSLQTSMSSYTDDGEKYIKPIVEQHEMNVRMSPF